MMMLLLGSWAEEGLVGLSAPPKIRGGGPIWGMH